MNKWLEYLSLVPKGFKNPEKVLEGIYNSVKLENGSLPLHQQEEIVRRRLICAGCPNMSKNKIGYSSKRTEEHCTLCSCPITTKTASLSSDCGAKTYNEKHSDPQPILWEKYIKK